MKFDKQTIEFYNTNAQKYSSYSYEHEKDELYERFLNQKMHCIDFFTIKAFTF